MPRIAFDGQSLYGGKSGLGVYTASLSEALKQTSAQDGVEIDFFPESGSPFCSSLNTPKRLQWEVFGFPAQIKNKKYDLVHSPAFAMGWPRIKTILTVHDLIGMTFPNQAGAASRFYWGQWLPWAVKRADHLITDSVSTRKDITRLLGIDESKISLIYPSGHERFSAEISTEMIAQTKVKLGIHGNYFMFVGTLEPRKNLPRVIQAFQKLIETHPDFQLVLIGSKEFAHGKYTEELGRQNNLGTAKVLAPGFIDHASLNALYCGARALVFPSLYEGFGFPIIEAMASGCPVITSTLTSMPEVCGDAGILVDPYSVDEIAAAMKKIAANDALRNTLRSKGFQQLKKFSWAAAAQKIRNLYRKLI